MIFQLLKPMDQVQNSNAQINNLPLDCKKNLNKWIYCYNFPRRFSFKFTYVTRTFPSRLMVDRPCNVPRARLITCDCSLLASDFDGAFCFVIFALRRNTVFLLWWCWACLNLLPPDAVVPTVEAPTRWMVFWLTLPATEHSFDWFDSTQSVRAFGSDSLKLPSWLRLSPWILQIQNTHIFLLFSTYWILRLQKIDSNYLLFLFFCPPFLAPCLVVIDVDNRTLTGSYDCLRIAPMRS